MKTLREQQIEAEENTLRSSVDRFMSGEVDKAEGGRMTQVERGTIPLLLGEVTAAIKKEREECSNRAKGVSWARTKLIPDEVMALVALRVFWGSVTNQAISTQPITTLTGFLRHLGKFLEGASCIYLADQEGVLQGITKKTKDQRSVLRMIRAASDLPAWEGREFITHATPLYAALEAAGLVKTEVVHKSASNHVYYPVMTERASDLLKSTTLDEAAIKPTRIAPLLCPPDPWHSLEGGGFLTKSFKSHHRLVPSMAKAWAGKSLRKAVRTGALKGLFKTLNSLQEIPLAINQDTLWLRKFVREQEIEIQGTTPTYRTVEVTPYPEEFDRLTPTEKFTLVQKIKRQKALNVEIPALLNQWDRDTVMAEEFSGRAFYLAYFLDFRTRVYPCGSFHHHKSEPVKALFQFHEGKPLGKHGLKWLMVHVANTGDFNKISKGLLEERLAWVAENLSDIEEMVDDPENCRMWAEADSPFCFYAACCDLVRALRSPCVEEYVSRIPVALDGSNSGVQHYSAALRAPEGKFVCLTDTGVQDLYASVATQAFSLVSAQAAQSPMSREESLQAVAKISAEIKTVYEFARERTGCAKGEKVKLEPEEKEFLKALKKRREGYLANIWTDEGISRSTVKRSVMTFAYSAAAYGFGQQIQEDYMDPLSRKVDLGLIPEHPFGVDQGEAAARYLGSLVYRATKEVLPKVAEGMQWLQKVASLLAKEGKGVTMTTPLGFPVHIFNKLDVDEGKVRIWTKLLDMRIRLKIEDEKKEPTVCASRQKSSVAPNIIHACDASHLLKTATACFEKGMQLLLIHDSFATHAGDVQDLSWILRKTMVDLYTNWCPFQQVYDEALLNLKSEELREQLPLPPEKGSLDLQELHHALYAFM